MGAIRITKVISNIKDRILNNMKTNKRPKKYRSLRYN